MLRAAGFDQGHDSDHPWMFVVKNINIDFIRPARLNQQLLVVTEITACSGARIEFSQQLLDQQQQCYCRAQVQVACLDSHSFRPTRIPNAIKEELTRAH